MNCPKCNSVMELVRYQEVEIDRCVKCGGLWLDNHESSLLTLDWVTGFLDTGDLSIGESQDEIDEICCPRCGDRMENYFDLENSQISYEVCVRHGKFFDAGEFSAWLLANFTT